MHQVHDLTSRLAQFVADGYALPLARAEQLHAQIEEAERLERLERYQGNIYEGSGVLGLSNTPYLHASTDTLFIRVRSRPGGLEIAISDPISKSLTDHKPPRGVRGCIRSLSDSSRLRLVKVTKDLEALGHIPQIMFTGTAAANWERVYISDENGEKLEGGRVFKQQIRVFREKLTRKMEKLEVFGWSALWWMEFQERGAPHLHMILFNCQISRETREKLRKWAGSAWANSVDNPDKIEKQKNIRAGTRIEKMRKQHFGYASKYASKMQQKQVPEDFQSVGRFWGFWNFKNEPPIELNFDVSRENKQDFSYIGKMLYDALETVRPFASPKWFFRIQNKILTALYKGIQYSFGFSIYGSDATKCVLSALES
jgi:hypothetical protein